MKYGFIGIGHMASAIIGGMVKNGAGAEDILCYNRTYKKAEDMAARLGVTAVKTISDTVAAADAVVISVTPQSFPEVLPEIKRHLTPGKLVISIAAGRDIAYLKENLGADVPVVRVMPNVNAKVCASTTCFTPSADVTKEHKDMVWEIFGAVGQLIELTEEEFTPFKAIAGCGVAFAYMYIDACARAGVKYGLSKEKALSIAASTVMGSARLVAESGEHPFALIDQVTTPGGTTIEGILSLQANGFEHAVHEAMRAVIEKDAVLSGK